ncbi:MAG: metal-sensitive transcriptional regulator [Caulobacteraceae bacterium]
MNEKFTDGRLELHRTPEEKEPLVQRLRRIEGQVRGLQQMIEQDRYCLEEVQQINAILAATKEVSIMLVSQHMAAGLERAIREDDTANAVEEIKTVLRAALRQA